MKLSLKERVCAECSLMFKPVNKERKHCHECIREGLHRKEPEPAIFTKENCKWCNKIFNRSSFQPSQIYCCKKCSRKFFKDKQKQDRKITHFEIFEHNNFTCQYCGKTIQDNIKLTVDHIYPLIKGGKSDRFNLTTACEACNSTKGTSLLSIENLILRWKRNPKHYTYKEALTYWNNEAVTRNRNHFKQAN